MKVQEFKNQIGTVFLFFNKFRNTQFYTKTNVSFCDWCIIKINSDNGGPKWK